MQEDEKQDDSGNAAKEDPTGIVRQAVEKRYQQGTRKTDPRFGERVQQHVARGCRKNQDSRESRWRSCACTSSVSRADQDPDLIIQTSLESNEVARMATVAFGVRACGRPNQVSNNLAPVPEIRDGVEHLL